MNSFNEDRETDLGQALGEALKPANPRRFYHSVMAAADQLGWNTRVSLWEILGDWAKPGMAAAVFLGILGIAAAMFALRSTPEYEATIDDALHAGAVAPERSLLMASPSPPTVDFVLAASVQR